MSKWIKRAVFLVTALLIISIVGVAVFFLTFDPNAYKDRLEDFVYQRYERHLTIDGDISLSLFPRIGLSVQELQLSDKGSSTPFAAVKQMRVSVAVWPLLWNRLVIDHLSLDGVQAWFKWPSPNEGVSVEGASKGAAVQPVEQHGQTIETVDIEIEPDLTRLLKGWLMPTAQAQPLKDAVHPRMQRSEFQVDIAGLAIQDATLYFSGPQHDGVTQLRQLSVNTGRVTLDQPFDLSLKGYLYNPTYKTDLRVEGQAILQLDALAQRLLVHSSNTHFSGLLNDFKVDSGDLRASAEYLLGQALDVEQLALSLRGRWHKLSPQTEGSLQLNAQSLGMHWGQQQLWWEQLNLRAHLGDQRVKTELALESPTMLMSPTQADGAPMQGSLRYAQGQTVAGLKLGLSDFSSGWQALEINNFALQGQYQSPHQLWQLDLDSAVQWAHEEQQLLFSAAHGGLSLKDKALPQGQSTRLLEGDFFIEPFNGHAAGELTAKLEQHGPINDQLSWFLWFDAANRPARLITHLESQAFDLNHWLPPAEVRQQRRQEHKEQINTEQDSATKGLPRLRTEPVDELAWRALPIDWSWRFEAQELRLLHLWLEQVQAHGLWQQDALQVSELSARMHEGAIQGQATWLGSQEFFGTVNLDGVDMAALLAAFAVPPFLQGHTQLQADWYTQGSTWAAWQAGLDLDLQAQVEQGAFLGFSVWEQVDAANEVIQQLFAAQLPPMPEQFSASAVTPFVHARFGLKGEEGQLQFSQFELEAEDYAISLGQPAWADLANRQLELGLILSLQLPKPSVIEQSELSQPIVAVKRSEGEQLVVIEQTESSQHATAGRGEGVGGRAAHRYSFAQALIPLRLSGPFDALQLRWQWSAMRHRFVQEAIAEGLLDKLGVSVYDALSDPPEPERSVLEALVEDTAKYFGVPLKEFLQN